MLELILEPDLEIEGREVVVPLLLQKPQGNGAVDASRQEYCCGHGVLNRTA
jgi:hypothetical protein